MRGMEGKKSTLDRITLDRILEGEGLALYKRAYMLNSEEYLECIKKAVKREGMEF